MVAAISSVYRKYATFSGRASRSEYWWFACFGILVYLALVALGSITDLDGPASLLLGTFVLLSLLPNIAVTVRRLHDTGRSGAWFFIGLVPLIGGIWLLVLMCLDSTADNEYGPRPDSASSSPARAVPPSGDSGPFR